MAAGLPIVATKTAGVPELVSEGETGFLAEPKNPDALAETIIRSLSHKEKLEEMGRIGRKRVEEFFSLEKMIKENELFYEGLIKEKGVL
jgi:glycosyltransferase involved in cell wall biosynthesis